MVAVQRDYQGTAERERERVDKHREFERRENKFKRILPLNEK